MRHDIPGLAECDGRRVGDVGQRVEECYLTHTVASNSAWVKPFSEWVKVATSYCGDGGQ